MVFRKHRHWEDIMDRSDFPAPEAGLLLTHFIVVSDTARSREFYKNLLDAEVIVEENPVILKAANSWVIMNPGGPGTPDKPETTLDVPNPDAPVSSFLNVRVADIEGTHARLRKHGIEFLTDPWDRKAEIRAYVRDPDGHLIEVGEATGILEGIHAG
jgi:catechol 2,3-dioxygenase-like lactoylglutathione lyase family enzyme